MYILKRDGREAEFDPAKIYNAIIKAFVSIDEEATKEDMQIASKIASVITGAAFTDMTVEEIQDMVEQELMKSDRPDVAKAYIIYRSERNKIRRNKSDLMRRVGEKVMATNVQNQNANIDEHSFGGRKGEVDAEVMREYALDNIISKMARENHMNNEIYIHDLDSYAVGMHNCLSIPFDKLLAEGFKTKQTDIRPAGSLKSAFQLVAVIFQLQSLQQFGGVSATHLDWTMVPYARKSFFKHWKTGQKYLLHNEHADDLVFMKELSIDDQYYKKDPEVYEYAMDMLENEVYQSIEAMYHNLNTLQSRSGNQLPFTSINYGTCTLPEGRMVTKGLLEVSIEGIGSKKRTPIFPCGIFQMMKGVNKAPEDPNWDLFQLALKSTALRLYPNYANVDWSGNEGYDPSDPTTYFSTMGCRTANGFDINGLAQQKDGRGNICPVTIILPTLAMETQSVESFMHLLDKKIHEAKDMLIERFNYICSQPMASARFMYENGTMAGYVPEEGIRSALKHGTLAIGQLGLAECLQILIGCDHTEEKGMELAIRIEKLFQKRCKEFKEKYRLNFGVYYTPAENLCYTAMKKFKAKYGEIPNVSENDFFTNSMHVPVWKRVSIIDKIDIESKLTGFSSAGCITYVEFDSGCKHNLLALETVVLYAMDHDIPYFAVNVPNDMCCDCGFTDYIDKACPMCGGTDIRRLRRVTGYLTDDYRTTFNKGKQQEVEMRFVHSWFRK